MASDRPTAGPISRRRYSAELKAEVMAECDAPGASVARVAMSHGINANVVHRWRQLAREGSASRRRPGVCAGVADDECGARRAAAKSASSCAVAPRR